MSRAQHLAIYLPSLHGGGAERVMVGLANALATNGHRVDLVLARAEGAYLREVAADVRIVDLDRPRVLASLPALITYLRHERPDGMLSALAHANLIAIVARAASGAPCRLVVSERNSLTGLVGTSGFAMRLLMRWLYPCADVVVAVSEGIAAQLVAGLNLYADRVVAIPNPVDVDKILRLAEQAPGHPWILPGQPPVFLAVGRLTEQKDYPTLLAAFALVRARRAARLVILGEGELREDIQGRIEALGLSNDVALLGFQANPYGWMKACAAYVLSSRWEGFPNTLVQAMACGASVVSTDCPTGPSEILAGGTWGRLVPPGDAGALAGAMTAAIDDRTPADVPRRLEAYQVHDIVARYEAQLRGK